MFNRFSEFGEISSRVAQTWGAGQEYHHDTSPYDFLVFVSLLANQFRYEVVALLDE